MRKRMEEGSNMKSWEETWVGTTPLKIRFLRLYYLSLQCNETVTNMGFWDSLQWNWNLAWRRSIFQWEIEHFDALMMSLQEVDLHKKTPKIENLLSKHGGLGTVKKTT